MITRLVPDKGAGSAGEYLHLPRAASKFWMFAASAILRDGWYGDEITAVQASTMACDAQAWHAVVEKRQKRRGTLAISIARASELLMMAQDGLDVATDRDRLRWQRAMRA